MYEESIEELNKWFDDEERSYFTGYNEDGEYTVSPSDVYDFCEYLREHEPDLIGIRVLIKENIHFTREDLEDADYC